MSEDQRFLAIGCYINSALYLAGVFVAGIVYRHPHAVHFSLASAGFSFLGYFAQVANAKRSISAALVILSVGLGAVAGLLLLH